MTSTDLDREHGDHPFGAPLVDADGEVVAEAESTFVTESHPTGRAKTMCSGAIYRSGIRRRPVDVDGGHLHDEALAVHAEVWP